MTIGYRKNYRLRLAVPNAKCVEVTIPYEVIEREAGKENLTVKEFIMQFEAVAEYDNFEGVHYTFRKRDGGDAT